MLFVDNVIVAGSSVAVAVAFRNNTNHGWVVVKFIHQEQRSAIC